MAAASLIPPPQKMDLTGDVVSNWEYFLDSWNNYSIAIKLFQEEKLVIVVTLKTVMDKECHQVLKNLPLTDAEREDHEEIVKKTV